MIRGCIGFSYIKGNLYGTMILVRGKRTINVPLPRPLYDIMKRLWTSKNILGKILYKNSTDWREIQAAQKD